MKFNLFHILGDVSHTSSKLILIWAIHSNSSAEGVSLITQVLYALVFSTRYLDIFTSSATKDVWHTWNFSLKIFYTLSSLYIIFLMTSVYARTREREKAWKFGMYCLLGSVVIAPFWYLIFKSTLIGHSSFLKFLWVFSEILESVCVIPQLLLLRQTTVPTVIDSFYLVALGTYRFLYVLNWIVRGVNEKDYHDPTSWVWGSIQTALMIDFAWVYWTRQRVKLRHGGVVDSDDLGRGWIVGRFVGRKSMDFDYDEETGGRSNDNTTQPQNKWGRRGISVSADEGVEGAPKRNDRERENADPESQPLADPAAFEDESDDDTPLPAGAGGNASVAEQSGVRSDEWDDDVDEDAREHDSASKTTK
ncbi:er lumen protein retaining receptor [Stemphylium lycopersici]|uniref:Er lumen protein retaining receptor n=1 Tax=Stemphylium lycopersici TaxID=183478 RepID=A0A364N9K3_STELY|nr:er lumen protein retaining receptor [Stemphylium lycopersici]RAR09336.1 er lumen protein retaining receptor [Stemphylium lycopersici]RAR14028.1 er lumen protein retaining receptor [Stemphylium lycopersici]